MITGASRAAKYAVGGEEAAGLVGAVESKRWSVRRKVSVSPRSWNIAPT
ncbi:hypothetical protein N5079_05495 [Planotetraspora sp. A-T 1434]|nr:hypothetical protein [Planotetraspora sp. A-T 1434]MCT9929673.1 hypothetical protein [Planotetraspora sp. A-T 1434]